MANDEQKKQTGNQSGTKPQAPKPASQTQKPTFDSENFSNRKNIGQIRKGSINEGQVARPKR